MPTTTNTEIEIQPLLKDRYTKIKKLIKKPKK